MREREREREREIHRERERKRETERENERGRETEYICTIHIRKEKVKENTFIFRFQNKSHLLNFNLGT